MFRYLTSFFLTTIIRARERKSIPSFMKIIKEALMKNVALSIWLIETFNNSDLIRELLIDCPISDMKRFISGLLKTAMKNVYKYEEKAIIEYIDQSEQDIIKFIKETQVEFEPKIQT